VLLAVGEIEHRQANVMQVVRAAHPPRCFSRGLNRRQQQRDQYADDRDYDNSSTSVKPTRGDRSRMTLPLHKSIPIYVMNWIPGECLKRKL